MQYKPPLRRTTGGKSGNTFSHYPTIRHEIAVCIAAEAFHLMGQAAKELIMTGQVLALWDSIISTILYNYFRDRVGISVPNSSNQLSFFTAIRNDFRKDGSPLVSANIGDPREWLPPAWQAIINEFGIISEVRKAATEATASILESKAKQRQRPTGEEINNIIELRTEFAQIFTHHYSTNTPLPKLQDARSSNSLPIHCPAKVFALAIIRSLVFSDILRQFGHSDPFVSPFIDSQNQTGIRPVAEMILEYDSKASGTTKNPWDNLES